MKYRPTLFFTSKSLKWCVRGHATAVAACPQVTPSPCRSCIPDMLAVEPSCVQPEVLIVGAGLAGLSAAERLIQCGIKNVTILEALARPGGRIFTEIVDGVPMELGSTWITGGCPGNTVFSLACQDNVIESPVHRPLRETGMAFDSSGTVFQNQVFNSSVKMFSEILSLARQKVGKERKDVDLWTYLGKEISSVAKYFPDRDKAAAKCIMNSFTLEVRNSFGSELSRIPLTKYGCLKELPGGDVPVKNGMISVLGPLLRAVQDKRIKYNTAVKKIIWRNTPGKSRINVLTCDEQVFVGDYVIVTVPLGVLKCYNKELFEPPLPTDKQEAIGKIGQGFINNICLKYKKPFWIANEGCIRTCWSREEIIQADHWTKSVSLIEPLPTTDDTDTLYLKPCGSAAAQIETLTDCEILEDVTRMIRKFLGNPSIPMPSHVVRSKWNNHPRFMGAVSFLGMDSSLSDIHELGKPVPEEEIAPTLLFAGEATASGFQGTTHGARLSGIREAERILHFTKCFCGPPPKYPRTCNF